ncbi:MAG: hypothetical protein O7D32_02620 [bacterium]|nr:hypothetical protein [bacterium]
MKRIRSGLLLVAVIMAVAGCSSTATFTPIAPDVNLKALPMHYPVDVYRDQQPRQAFTVVGHVEIKTGKIEDAIEKFRVLAREHGANVVTDIEKHSSFWRGTKFTATLARYR